MPTLHRILRRAHCRDTHHLYAVDGLQLVQTAAGKRLVSWLYRCHKDYLTGATDPDTRIRDFQNQIIHVEDGYWGGGPRVAWQWYNRLLQCLCDRQYAQAAQAAGILSHYFTDALQPLHTGETRREALVHLPFERSVFHAYDELREYWMKNPLRQVFQLPDGCDWLRLAMLDGARQAHQKFSLLVNAYQFDDGIVAPMAGLNQVSRVAMADLVGLALSGWARVIERAAWDAENRLLQPMPTATGTVPLLTATLSSPIQMLRRRRQIRSIDSHVKAIAKEYRRKGVLQKHLPHEVDIKQRVNQVRRDEKIYQAALAKRAEAKRALEKSTRAAASPSDATRPDASSSAASLRIRPVQSPVQSPVHHLQAADEDRVSPDRIDGRLLMALGYQATRQLATADARLLYAELMRLVLTKTGQRLLQGQTPPTLLDVQKLLDHARKEKAA